MAIKTQIKLAQMTGSMPSSSNSAAAASSVVNSDLSGVLDHLASAVKRIHGASTFSQAAAGEFSASIVPASDGGANLGSSSKEWAQVHTNRIDSAAALDVNVTTGITVDATTVSIDGTDDSNVTVTGSGKDLSLIATGGGAQVLQLASAGTGTDAIDINATAGGIDIDANGAIAVDSASTVTLTGAGVLLAGGSSEVDVTTSGAFDVNVGSVDLDSSAGIAMDGTTVSIDGTDDSNVTVTGSGKDLSLQAAGGGAQVLQLASAGTGADAIDINATAGGMDVDVLAAINIATTGAAGDISLVSAHTAGVAFHIDANANAASEVQIDAGILDMDVTGAATLDAGGSITLTGAGVLLAGGSSEVDITTSGALDMNSGAMTLDASTISLDGTGQVNIDTTDTSDGLKLGTATSGVPITIGHGTSEVTVADNLTVSGDLTVNGATTTISTTNMVVEDKLIELGNGTSGSPSGDAGRVIERGSSNNAVFVWDESEDEFFLGTGSFTGASTGDLSLTAADMQAGVIRSSKLEIDAAGNNIDVDTDLKLTAVAGITLDAAADIILDADGADVILKDGGTESARFTMSGTTSVELASQGDIILDPAGNNVLPGADSEDDLGADGTAWRKLYVDDIDLNGVGRIDLDADADTSIRASSDDVITFEVSATDEFQMAANVFSPASSDGAALGSSSLQWSDLFLADGAVLNLGGGGMTLTHSTDPSLGSDIKGTHGPNLLSSQTFNTSLSSLAFHGLGSDLSSSHAGNLNDSFIGSSDSSVEFVSSSAASNFASALGGGGTVARFDDGSSVFDIEFGSYSSGTSISVISITVVAGGSSVSKSGLQGSGTIKVVSTSGSDANSAASAFASAIGGGGAVVRFDDNNGNKIDYTFSSYSSGASVSISSASQAQGSAVSLSGIANSSAGGSIKVVSSFTDQMAFSDTLVLSDHNGSSTGLKLASTLVTATGAELNLLDGGTSVGSSITIANSDGMIINDGGTMKSIPMSDLKTFVGGGRTKKSATQTGAVSADAVTTVSGMSHDLGADPDLSDVYLNGQLMLSGSSASNGDYQINGASGGSSLSVSVGSLTSGQTFTTSTTTINFDSAIGSSTADALPNGSGKVLVMENSAGTVRFEGSINGSLLLPSQLTKSESSTQ